MQLYGCITQPMYILKETGNYTCARNFSHLYHRIAKSAATITNWILGAFKDRSPGIMLLVYKALVQQILEYCCVL